MESYRKALLTRGRVGQSAANCSITWEISRSSRTRRRSVLHRRCGRRHSAAPNSCASHGQGSTASSSCSEWTLVGFLVPVFAFALPSERAASTVVLSVLFLCLEHAVYKPSSTESDPVQLECALLPISATGQAALRNLGLASHCRVFLV